MATDGVTTAPSPDDELTQLRASLQRSQQELELLRAERWQSVQALELLRAERQQLLEDRQRDIRTIEQLQHQIEWLRKRLFGSPAEKLDPRQLVLFEKLQEELRAAQAAQQARQAAANAAPPSADASRPKNKGNGHGRGRLPANLEREKRVHDLPEDQKPCPCCGKMRVKIGEQISEQLEFIPAKVKVIEHVQLTYACRSCDQKAAETGAQVTTAAKPLVPIHKGLAGPGLLAYVMVSKYGDHLPLHRLERIFERHGIEIARSTMCDWAAQCAQLLRPLHDRMKALVLQSKVIHTDDTPVDVLDKDVPGSRQGRFWVYLGDSDHPFTVFDYTPNRRRDGPMQFLQGWGRDRRVYLQADAFGGYDVLYDGQAGGQVTEVACWAHGRRKFYEARNANAQASMQALAYIRLLYDVEDQAKAEFASQDEHAEADARRSLAAIRHGLRQQLAMPRLAEFKAWLKGQQIEQGGSVLPRSPMGEAITYALNQWDALCVYTTDGNLAIDNNAAENALRRVALGRKNWLFCGSDNGGNTAAVHFSLIATCQRHKVEPMAYMRDVLDRIATTPPERLDELLPDRWRPITAE